MKFQPIVANPDLDTHDDPPSLWQRVAVVCRWKDAHAFRKRWPHATVVGPLRTLRGLDELIRNLLHNPVVRCIVLDGNDLTPDEETTKALLAVWKGSGGWEKYVADDLRPHLLVRTKSKEAPGPLHVGLPIEVHIVTTDEWNVNPESSPEAKAGDWFGDRDEDRSGGRITLPPPPPTASAPAPHGDPGERVAANTLDELWPMVLHRAMRFGRVVPTQYGDTREVLNLVSVIRDPAGFLEELSDQPHPVLGITRAQAEAYYERITGKDVPEGAAYAYGSRLAGTPDKGKN